MFWSTGGVTRDISFAGVYFYTAEALDLGDRLHCVIALPNEPLGRCDGRLCLECRVEVVRIEALRDAGSYGVGCSILEYRVLRSEGMLWSGE